MIKFIDFDTYEFAPECVPDHAQEELANYLMKGWAPGGFMTAMLAGDLFSAAVSGDQTNGPAMQGIANWIVHSAPKGSYGSREAIVNWCRDVEGCRTRFAIKKEKEYIIAAIKA